MSEKVPYMAPKADLGDVVFWYPDFGAYPNHPQPGIVTGVGHGSLCINLLQPNTYNMLIRDGVRHVKDPDAQDMQKREAGLWDYTPKAKRLAKALSMIEDLYGRSPAPEAGKK